MSDFPSTSAGTSSATAPPAEPTPASSSTSSAAAPRRHEAAINAPQIERRRLKRKYAVKRLEKKMEQYHRQIKKFTEEEVSLDDMLSGKSAYLMEDYLKRKFIATWEELCHLLKIPSTIEVTHEDGMDVSYSGTSYPEINRRVSRLLRSDEFPDHMDICELVDRCNTKHSLGISVAEKAEISRKVFKEVGKIIKSRRIKDYRAHFGSHLTDSAMSAIDPASEDSLLMEALQRSLKEGKERMQKLVEDFVTKQELEGSGGKGSSHEDSGTSDEEEEEEGEVGAEEMERTLRSSQGGEEKEASSADENEDMTNSPDVGGEPETKKPKLDTSNHSNSNSLSPNSNDLGDIVDLGDIDPSPSASTDSRNGSNAPVVSTSTGPTDTITLSEDSDVVIIDSD